jgi:hypothetical protein
MQYLKHLLRSITVLNVILMATVIYLADYTFLHPHLPSRVIKFAPPSATKPLEAKKDEAAQNQVPSPSDYTIIAEQNIFHPERKIPVDKPAAVALPVPEFILFGTLITDDVRIAYMEDKKAPVSSPGRGKRQIPLKKGESLSGFSLLQIDGDRVLMARGDEKISVLLSSPKVREVAAVAAAHPPAPDRGMPFPVSQTPAPAGAAPPPQVLLPPAPGQQPAASGASSSAARRRRGAGTTAPPQRVYDE